VRWETKWSFDGNLCQATCVRGIRTKNYQDLVTGFKVTIENVGNVFLGHSVVIVIVVCNSSSGHRRQRRCTISKY